MTYFPEVKISLVFQNLEMSILIDLPWMKMPREILNQPGLKEEKN
jgi:hypothetical protein